MREGDAHVAAFVYLCTRAFVLDGKFRLPCCLEIPRLQRSRIRFGQGLKLLPLLARARSQVEMKTMKAAKKPVKKAAAKPAKKAAAKKKK